MGMIISFGRFEVDLENRMLRKAGLTVRLAPQPFTVLAALLEAGGEIVTRDELRGCLWPDGTFLEYEQAINVSIRRLREVLGESGSNPTYIETIPRVGYRWIFPLPAVAQAADTSTNSRLRSQDSADSLDGPMSREPIILESETSKVPIAKRSFQPPPPQRRRRWMLAAAVLAVSAATVMVVFLVRKRPAGKDLPRSIFTRSSSAAGEVLITRDAADSKCLNFAGRWRTTSDLSDMQIIQSGCTLTGSFESADGGTQHTFTGVSSSDDAAVVVERTDFRNCRTEMEVGLYLVADHDLVYVVSGTAGRCGLRQNYRETRVWKPAGS